MVVASNGDKRLKTFDRITTYPYGYSTGKVCKTKLLKYMKKMINFDDYTNENQVHDFKAGT